MGPYTFPNVLIDYVRHESPAVKTGWWRGIGPTHNTFVAEGFIDELAFTAKQDPVRYRASLLTAHPRATAVLERAASLAKWGDALPVGTGRGVALTFAFGSYIANVAEVSVAPNGDLTIKRMSASSTADASSTRTPLLPRCRAASCMGYLRRCTAG